ncbi:MAG: hypothetical protein J6W52_04415 [Bacteroidaceae bacterium]|nr:hypothetical protein [Bacteroidaceae bacterium]
MNNTDNMNHNLPLAIANELNRMEANLIHMQPDVRGYKQLSQCVERMKTTLQAYGYEIVNMLGQSYTDGMRVMARFVIDEQMAPEEAPRITSVVRPQVNYQGQMIQVAEVTVSQPL